MDDDIAKHLEAAIRAARKKRQPKSRIREVPRPTQELNEALHRWHGILAYHEPALWPLTLTTLYEYAARRMLRDSITEPDNIAADLIQYRHNYPAWWEQWRSK